jgi:hypothetical protein
LYFVLIKNLSGKEATIKMEEILAKKTKFDWIEPPVPNGQKTVIDVLRATSQEEHEKKVREWAKDVWNCWYSKHKQTIDRLVNDNF